MKHWEILAAAIAVLTGVWSQVRAIAGWFRGLVVVRCRLQYEAADVITSYLAATGRGRSNEPRYGMQTRYIAKVGSVTKFVYEIVSRAPTTFLDGWRPLWFVPLKSENGDDVYVFRMSWIRGTVDWDDLTRRALAWAATANTERNRHQIIYHYGKTMADLEQRGRAPVHEQSGWDNAEGLRLLHWAPEDFGRRAAGLHALALSPALVDVSREIGTWSRDRAWYADHGLTWRRGYLFEGAPGCGKSSLARAEAEDLDLPVHVLDLATMSNQDLRDAWNKVVDSTPCMVLIEDIDAVFHGRENVTKGSAGMMASGGLTFDALLNVLDGVQRADGVLTIVTTNHLDKVDPALRNRPGRIDRVVHFEALDHAGRVKIAARILGDDRAERAALEHSELSAAAFTEACSREALAERFEDTIPEGPYR
jgi:hypothetical protein